MENLWDIGFDMILFLQSLGGWLTAPMKFLSFLGNEEFFLLIMPVFYWSISPAIGLRLGILLLLSASLNSVIKLLGHSPRPYWYSSSAKALVTETSFGFPSGHAMNAASVWGGLAASLKRRWVWIAAVLLIFLIGLSRIYTGVHFPLDVLAGWMLGALLLAAYLRLEKPVSAWAKQLNLNQKIGAALALSLALIVLGALARLSLGAWTLPAAWLAAASAAAPEAEEINPLSLSGIVSNAGALFGLLTGAVMLQRWGGYDGGGLLWKRTARFGVGLLGVLLFWRVLGMFLPGGEDPAGYIFRYLRYSLTGFWIAGLGPLVFLKLGLASRPPRARKENRARKARRRKAGLFAD